MRLAAIATVKNEGDIVEAFVRHTLHHVGYLAILENGSSDDTLTVLRSLEKEGLPLEVVVDPTPGYFQVERMNRLLREYARDRYHADWTLCLDADEFVAVEPGAELTPARAGGVVEFRWRTYTPQAAEDPAPLNPVLRIRHRYDQEKSLPKIMISKQAAALAGGSLVQGNHQFLCDGVAIPGTPHPAAYLGHFPIRSPGQYLAKIAIAALQFQAKGNQQGNANLIAPFELLKQDPNRFLETFHDASRRSASSAAGSDQQDLVLRTIDSPFPYQGGELRYTRRVDDRQHGWLAVLHYADDLTRRYAILSSSLSADDQVQLGNQAEALRQVRTQLHEQQRLVARYQKLLALEGSWLGRAARAIARTMALPRALAKRLASRRRGSPRA